MFNNLFEKIGDFFRGRPLTPEEIEAMEIEKDKAADPDWEKKQFQLSIAKKYAKLNEDRYVRYDWNNVDMLKMRKLFPPMNGFRHWRIVVLPAGVRGVGMICASRFSDGNLRNSVSIRLILRFDDCGQVVLDPALTEFVPSETADSMQYAQEIEAMFTDIVKGWHWDWIQKDKWIDKQGDVHDGRMPEEYAAQWDKEIAEEEARAAKNK